MMRKRERDGEGTNTIKMGKYRKRERVERRVDNNNNNNNIFLKSNIHSIIRYKFSGLYNGIKHS